MQEPFDFDDHLYVGFPLRYTRSGAEESILCKVCILLAKTCLTTSHNYYSIYIYIHSYLHTIIHIYMYVSLLYIYMYIIVYIYIYVYCVYISIYIMLCSNFGEKVTSVTLQLDCHNPEAWAGGGVSFAPWQSERPW